MTNSSRWPLPPIGSTTSSRRPGVRCRPPTPPSPTAELALFAARHEADHRAGRIVVRSGDDGAPVPEVSQNAAGPAWEQLRFCESGGNYAIADSSGMFRGAYQFAISTWYGMGGVGDPADAPPSEQDYRAQILYDALGAKPWPVCGRFLIEDPPPRADALPGLVDNLPPDQPLTGPGVTTLRRRPPRPARPPRPPPPRRPSPRPADRRERRPCRPQGVKGMASSTRRPSSSSPSI